MTLRRVAGIILLVVGVILLLVGIIASDSVADQVSSFFTGHFTDKTVWYMAAGTALAIGGMAALLFSGRVSKA